MKRRFFLFAGLLLCPLVLAPAEEQEQGAAFPPSIESMLASYIANDRQTQLLGLKYQQALLSHQSAQDTAGFDVTLSSGTVSVRPAQFSAAPALKISMPGLGGMVVDATFPLSVAASDGSVTLENAAVSVEAEIIGGTVDRQELSLLKSRRGVVEAERQLKSRVMSAEHDFYSELKSIYTEYASLLSAQNALYEAEIDLESLAAQGYGSSSSRYRTAELEVLNARHSAEERQRALQRAVERFAEKCSLEPGRLTAESLPDAARQLEASGILASPADGSLGEYAAMEQAEWNMGIAEFERLSDKAVTLSGGLGYTRRDAAFAGSDTVTASLSVEALGARLSAGVAVPLSGEDKTPAAQFSLSWSPGTLKSERVRRQESDVSVRLAALEILDAQDSYAEEMEAAMSDREDLLWKRTLNLEEAGLYRELAADMQAWFDAGFVTDAENRQAQVKLQNALIQCRINDIELLLSSIRTRMLFVTEDD